MQLKLRTLLLPFFVVAFTFFTSIAYSQATVITDKPDYAPRSNAVFTGSGFQPGEDVVLKVKNLFRACNTVTSDSSYLPWTVKADGSGSFVTNWTVCDCNGDSLRLRAVGQASHDTAYAYFSDAAGLSNLVIGSSIGSLTYGTGGSVSYSCTMKVSGNPTNETVNFTFSPALPSGVSANTIVVNGNSNPLNFTLTLTSSTTTPAITQNYTVTAIGTNANASSSSNALNFVVGKKALTVTADNKSVTYGAVTPSLTSTISGFANGQTLATSGVSGEPFLTTNYTNTTSVSASPVIITAGVGTLSASNYSFTLVNGQITISKATPIINWSNPADISYGTALTAAQLNATSGSVAGSFSYTPAANTILNAGNGQTLSVTFTPNDLVNNNVVTKTVNINIGKASSTTSITLADGPFIYTGSVHTPATVSVTGAGGLNLTPTAVYDNNTNAGTATASYSFEGDANHEPSSDSKNFTIGQKTASVTPAANSKIYGAADPALTGTSSGFLAADNVTASYSRVAGETVAGGPYTISATLNAATGVLANYDITYNTANFTIGQKTASVTPAANSKIYGAADPALTGTSSGFLAADNVTASYSRVAGETVAGGPYTISATLNAATGVLANYDITYNTANFTIGQKTASVTPAANSKIYGAADPALTGTSSGFLAADNVTASYSRVAGETVAGGPYTISATLNAATGVLANYDITYNTANFTIGQKTASVTPAANSKIYGAADPALTGTSSGFLAADNVTASYSRVAGETVAGGPYTISATLNAATGVLANYDITYNTANFTIGQKTASVTPAANSKIYGAADPALTGTSSGFLAADNVTASYSRVAGETVAGGPYTISATLNAATGVLANYDITYNTANFTIGQKTASVTPAANSKIYGAADPALTGTSSGFLAADNVTASYSRVAGETVAGGPYTISATLNAATGVLANYDITYNTANFTIGQKTASVTPAANSKIYGAADPALTGTSSGFLAADNVTASYSRVAGETVAGGPYTISATLNAATGVLANYDITYNTANFTIGQKTASVTPAANSKIYGAADPALTGTSSGFLAADNVTASYSRVAGETVAGGPYTISATLNAATGVLANYDITYNTANFTIGQKTASVTPAANSKIYGAADPALTGTSSGFLAADNVTASYSRVAGETVAGGPYTISATLNAATGVLANYDITYNTANFTIGQKTASVTPAANSKIYGAADPALTGTSSGFLAADNVTASYSRVAGETVAGGPYTISATLNAATGVLANYDITYNTANFTIGQKTASVTPAANSKIYGAADPALTGTSSGFLAADNVTASYSRVAGETVAGGPYTISATLNAATGVLANYDITYNTANFTIGQKTASVTPAANSKIYGAADPALTGTSSGFLAADNVTASYSRVAGETVAGGPYTISATLNAATGVLANYDITYNTANFTIGQKTASVTPAANSKIYGAADPALTGTSSGFLAADNVTASYSRVAGETVAGGPYTISATLNAATGVLANYDITYNTANFTIGQKTASVTPAANSKIYGAADPALTGTSSGFLAADNVTASYSRVAGETVAGGPYTISATLNAATGVLANYDITYNTANFTIGQKTASVTPAANSKIYGAADPALTGTSSGFLAADNVTASYSRVAGETVAGGPYTISATLNAATGVLANYDITYNTANFTIGQKTASVTPAANSKIYGAADPALTGTSSGFLAADNVTASYSRVAGETVAGGPYTISATLNAATGVLANYDITYNTANFTIGQKTASVTPAANSKIYGAADPALTGTSSGFLAADNVTASYSRVAGETVAGGPYTISATLNAATGVLANYDITYNTANFTIGQKTASVTPAANSKIYGAADPALTGTSSGFLAADNVTASYSRVAGETVAGGPYTISATLNAATGVLANYDITYNTANFTIGQKTASVTPAANSKIYGAADPALTGTSSGFLAADNVTASYSRVAGETVAGGPYTISATLNAATGVLANYDITYNTANFTIGQKTASVTPAANSKYCGQNNPTITGILSGFVSTDNVTPTYVISGNTISATLSPASILGNYNITYNTATLTINGVTIDASSSSTPVAVGTAVNLSAKVNPAVAGVSVTFYQDNVFKSTVYTNVDGVATLSVTGLIVDVYQIKAVAGSGCNESIVYLPVYDPNAGFVTGGGWINSPAGAYMADASLTGKANFGFVSKYKKGSTQVDGSTEFQFHAGSLNFKSLLHESGTLVIAGSKAMYKGTGTVNGISGYSFMVSAIDGGYNGGTSADRFRIKIWNTATSAIVYDNQNNSADNADLNTEGTLLGGGSVVIQQSTTKKSEIVSTQVAEQTPASVGFALSALPNPTTSNFKVKIESDNATDKITLKVVDMFGRTIQLFNNLQPGQNLQVGSSYRPGVYILEMTQGNNRKQLKLIKQNN